MNKKVKVVFSIFAVLLGVFIFIYGGYDDSPGAQLLGVLVMASGVANIIKKRKKKINKIFV
jgi:uncharacterized membrane protein HdeD (DUF308 family)